MEGMNRMFALTAAGFMVVSAPAGISAGPTVSPLSAGSVRIDWKVSLADPDRYNRKGNLIVAYGDHARRADLIRETTPDGSMVWECRLEPEGALTRFARAADGITLVAQIVPGKYSRILRIGGKGELRGGVRLAPESADLELPRVESLEAVADGGIFAVTRGYAFWATAKGRITRDWMHKSLRAASAFPDGSLICALGNPYRFARLDRIRRKLEGIPQGAFCHIWSADRTEALASGRFRLYGCFCFTIPGAERGARPERKTLDVVETDSTGEIAWSYGSPYSLRIDEFGSQRCANYTLQVLKSATGTTLIADSYQPECRIVELDAPGAPGNVLLSVPAISDPIAPGMTLCPLIGAQIIE
jgi:hypothetical protein